jgi:hypothetical protein
LGWRLEWLMDIFRLCRHHPIRKKVYIVIDGWMNLLVMIRLLRFSSSSHVMEHGL